MLFLYLIALIPIITGGILHFRYKEFSLVEWMIVGGTGFVLAGIFHSILLYSMTDDVETWSGEITCATHYPRWVEEYQEEHTSTSTDSNGNTTTHTYYTTEHRTHEQYWKAYTSLNTSHSISVDEFNDIKIKFNDLAIERVYKSGFVSGDHNIYTTHNKTHYVFPATCRKAFENKVKAAPSLFSFPEVPKYVHVFNYPDNFNWRQSDRLLGTARQKFDILKFDQLNADLGPQKHVNMIIVGFPSNSSNQDAEWQRAKWAGGKKNDLVVCYGGDNNGKAGWCTVFGWTEEELVKRNLETMFITRILGNDLFPDIKKEVVSHYIIKDWTKFDYLSIEPPTWAYWVYILIVTIIEGGIIFITFNNDLIDGEPRYGKNGDLKSVFKNLKFSWLRNVSLK